jgi:hypothetical protein
MSRRRTPLANARIELQRKHIDNRRRLLDQLIVGNGNVHAAGESMRALHASLYGDEGKAPETRPDPADAEARAGTAKLS